MEKSTALAIAKEIKGDKVFKQVKAEYYNQYHVKKVKFESSDATINFVLDDLNMTRAEFDKHAENPKVKALITEWDKGVAVANIQGVPAITVNGKYLINTKSIKSMNMLKDLIAELSAK